jgi:hypothetical protein
VIRSVLRDQLGGTLLPGDFERACLGFGGCIVSFAWVMGEVTVLCFAPLLPAVLHDEPLLLGMVCLLCEARRIHSVRGSYCCSSIPMCLAGMSFMLTQNCFAVLHHAVAATAVEVFCQVSLSSSSDAGVHVQ